MRLRCIVVLHRTHMASRSNFRKFPLLPYPRSTQLMTMYVVSAHCQREGETHRETQAGL